MARVTANVSGYHRIYVDDEVEVELDGFKPEDLAKHLETLGYRCIPPPMDSVMPAEPEYRLWEALRFDRLEELRRAAADLVYDRLGRIV
jgi:hypothetical protein